MTTPPTSTDTPPTASKDAPISAHTGKPVKYWPHIKKDGTAADLRPPQALVWALMRARLGTHAMAVALALIAILYQFPADAAAPKPASYDDFRDLTDLHPQLIRRALVDLEKRHVIEIKRGIGKRPSNYQLRPVAEWTPPGKATITGSAHQPSTHNGVSVSTHNGVSGLHSQRGERITHNGVSATNSFKHFSSTTNKQTSTSRPLSEVKGAPVTQSEPEIFSDDKPQFDSNGGMAESVPSAILTVPKPLSIERLIEDRVDDVRPTNCPSCRSSKVSRLTGGGGWHCLACLKFFEVAS